jgi:Putative restriction endonuclease
MSVAPLAYRWSATEFLRAWEAGVFDHRVELVDGEVWPVVIGSWHGDTQAQVAALLRQPGARVSTSTLAVPSDDSVPDPDCFVRRAEAKPVGTRGTRLEVWDPADVFLVVEISDDSVIADLNIKSRLYGGAGYAVYWVVTRDAVYEHISPTPQGYRTRNEYRRGDRIPVAYAATDLPVIELLGQGNE